jgi:hypothetical protein
MTLMQRRTRYLAHAQFSMAAAPRAGRSCCRRGAPLNNGQRTSGMVKTMPAKGTSGSIAHCSRCQSRVARLPQLVAALGLAGVKDDFLLVRRCIHFCAERGSTTDRDLVKVVTYCGTFSCGLRMASSFAAGGRRVAPRRERWRHDNGRIAQRPCGG